MLLTIDEEKIHELTTQNPPQVVMQIALDSVGLESPAMPVQEVLSTMSDPILPSAEYMKDRLLFLRGKIEQSGKRLLNREELEAEIEDRKHNF